MSKFKIVDPTRRELMRVLQPYRACITREAGRGGWDMARETAIYWFCSQYHGGQWSNLYSVLSTSPYRPGRLESGVDPDSWEGYLFEALVNRYFKKGAKKVNISKVYRAEGDVIGYLWGGGVASYPTGLPLFRAGSLEELRASIQAAIESGSIDRCGFEALIGAVMLVTTVSTVEVEGKNFMREDAEIGIFFHPRIAPCDHEKWTETFRQMLES